VATFDEDFAELDDVNAIGPQAPLFVSSLFSQVAAKKSA